MAKTGFHPRPCQHNAQSGFTLVELSIVLVIIGLIVGGILVGQDLINAARIRAQISQMDKLNTAMRAFQSKYNALPGDIPDPKASSFGFVPRGAYPGQGDGDGLIEGSGLCGGNCVFPNTEMGGETVLFWSDLSAAQLIEQTFNKVTSGTDNSGMNASTIVSLYIPAAKIGNANYIYVNNVNGANVFFLSAFTGTVSDSGIGGFPLSNVSLTVSQAYAIDNKIDDGLPQTGRVLATYLNHTLGRFSTGVWAAGGGFAGASPGTSALPSATTCYDNAGTTATMNYSLSQNTGFGLNCALSFQFQ